jgi:GNAT superfamily N-acetyltransferase
VSNRKIDVLGLGDIPLITDLYNQVYKPRREEAFFKRRFLGRYHPVIMTAVIDAEPVGFFLGFELKPSVFFEWLYGVLPTHRRQGIASQLMDASNAWARQHGYTSSRLECHNQHRPMLHLAIKNGYDIQGIRWDPDRHANLVIFEKDLADLPDV